MNVSCVKKSVSSVSLELLEVKLLSSTMFPVEACSKEFKIVEVFTILDCAGVEVSGLGWSMETSDTENNEIVAGEESMENESEAIDIFECWDGKSLSVSLLKAIFKEGTAKS